MDSLFLKIIFLFLIGCTNHESIKKLDNPVAPILLRDSSFPKTKVKGYDLDTFLSSNRIDTTINKNIILWNSLSTYNFFGDLSNKLQDSPIEGSFVIFKNKSEDRYLKMIHLPGSDPNTFRFFEVGYVKDLPKMNKLLNSNIINFETESGVKLGIKPSSLKKIKNIKYSEKKDGSKTILEISENIDGLQYTGAYYFEKDKLVKFNFGYINP